MGELVKNPVEGRLQAWHGESWHTAKGRIIRDIVYSVDTGLVTTVSFIAGISASLADTRKIIFAGLVQIIAGTLAIFFGAYASTKAQKHFFENQIEREKKEIEDDPQKETQEIRIIFGEMGFSKEEQEVAVRRITADKRRWLEFMAQEEIGISPESIDNPFEIGLVSASSFVIGAVPAIIPFFVFTEHSRALLVSAATVLCFLFMMGVWKARITKMRRLISGLETLAIGALSCGSGFLLGRIAQSYFH